MKNEHYGGRPPLESEPSTEDLIKQLNLCQRKWSNTMDKLMDGSLSPEDLPHVQRLPAASEQAYFEALEQVVGLEHSVVRDYADKEGHRLTRIVYVPLEDGLNVTLIKKLDEEGNTVSFTPQLLFSDPDLETMRNDSSEQAA